MCRANLLHSTLAGWLCCTLLAGCDPSPSAEITAHGVPYDRSTTAFVNVNVVTMASDEVLERRTVIVRDGCIASIAPAGEAVIPDDAVQIEGSGRWLIKQLRW